MPSKKALQNNVKCFCKTVYCAQHHFIKLKLYLAIENWYVDFMKIREDWYAKKSKWLQTAICGVLWISIWILDLMIASLIPYFNCRTNMYECFVSCLIFSNSSPIPSSNEYSLISVQ